MAYIKPPIALLSGVGLKASPLLPADNVSVVMDCDIATTSTVGMVKAGIGIDIDIDGTISTNGSIPGTVGNWLPKLVPSVVGNITLMVRNAKYSKIGQSVMATFDISITAISAGASDATISLQALPSLSLDDAGYVGSVIISFWSNTDTNIDYLAGTVLGNSTNADLWFSSEQKKTLIKLSQGDIKVGTRLVGMVQYITST